VESKLSQDNIASVHSALQQQTKSLYEDIYKEEEISKRKCNLIIQAKGFNTHKLQNHEEKIKGLTIFILMQTVS